MQIEKYDYLIDMVIKKYMPSRVGDEDLHQIGLIALWVAMNKYNEKGTAKFETYASKIIRNKIIDELRKEKREKAFLNNINNTISMNEEIHTEGNKTISIGDTIADKNGLEIIDTDMIKREFDSNDFKIINLKYKGYNNRDAAEIIGISKKDVDKKVKEMKGKIKCIVIRV